MRSLMSGDTVTDDLSSKHFKIGGTGNCKICGAPEGNLEHVLWKCVGPEGKWEQLRATVFKSITWVELENSTSQTERTCLIWPSWESIAQRVRDMPYKSPTPRS